MFLPCFEDVRGRNKHLKISSVQINWAKDVKIGQRETFPHSSTKILQMKKKLQKLFEGIGKKRQVQDKQDPCLWSFHSGKKQQKQVNKQTR